MAKTIVHVNQHIIRANETKGKRNPPLTIRQGRRITRAYEVDLVGPVKVVYRPDKPLSCGARVWIECEGVSGGSFDSLPDCFKVLK